MLLEKLPVFTNVATEWTVKHRQKYDNSHAITWKPPAHYWRKTRAALTVTMKQKKRNEEIRKKNINELYLESFANISQLLI